MSAELLAKIGTTSTPDCRSCAWTSSSVRTRRQGRPWKRTERKPLPSAAVHAIRTAAAARQLEQAARRLGR